MKQWLSVAEKAALAGGKAAARYFGQGLKARAKEDGSPVTEADLAAEHAMRRVIQRAFPAHAIEGEELGKTGAGPLRWVLDPIDATRNFVRAIPFYASLAALEKKGRVVAGAVYEPATRTLVSALKGKGAHWNGKKIRASRAARLRDAMLCFSGNHLATPFGRALRRLSTRCAYARGYGDYLGYLLVARGSAEAMLDPVTKPEDVAAVKVIVEEAGGRVTDFRGRNTHRGGSALAASKKLHARVLEALQEG